MSTVGSVPVYRFGLFELDARTGELRKQGLRLRLRGRPIDILVVLLERAGDVVTRDELRQRLWPADTFVDFDHGLHSSVNRLREALGDSAENPRFVETLPRRGYRFIAPVTVARVEARAPIPADPNKPESAAGPEAEPARPVPTPEPVPLSAPESASAGAGLRARRRTLAWAVGLAAAIALLSGGLFVWNRSSPVIDGGRMSIAVLPFQNLSGDPDQDYFSDGFTEEMIAELGMIGPNRLSVIGRTTSMLYKGAKKSIGEIGEELGVAYLLEGSVRRAGPRMRITAQLVETKGMTQLWADTYERDVGDVLTVQYEVARQIARSLPLARSTSPPPTTNPSTFEAYELLMRGRFFREQATEDGVRKAIDYFERALRIDPNYAAAHAAIADAYRLLGAPGWEVEAPSTLLATAKTAAERALALDPQSPQARSVLAMIKFNFDWDLAGAEREIKEALRLNPSSAQAHQYYSGILTPMGRREEAIAAAQRAMELDPLSPTVGTSLGVRYYYANRCDEAIATFLKTLEVTPGFAVSHWGLAQCYRRQGRMNEQIDQLRSAVQLSGNSTYMRAHLAYGYAVAGERSRAEALRHEIEAESRARYVAPYHFALIAAGLRDARDVMRWLERAYEDRSGWLVFLAVEPEFDWMRNVPEFQRLLARVRPRG